MSESLSSQSGPANLKREGLDNRSRSGNLSIYTFTQNNKTTSKNDTTDSERLRI